MATPSAKQVNGALVGFDRLYGLELLELSDTEVRARVAVRDELKQPVGLVHGGVYAAIAESITSLATAAAVIPEGNMATGQSNSTSFLRPITEGVVHALATRLHRGRTTWVWDVRFSDDAERTCAVTRMTIAVRPPPDGLRLHREIEAVFPVVARTVDRSAGSGERIPCEASLLMQRAQGGRCLSRQRRLGVARVRQPSGQRPPGTPVELMGTILWAA